MTQNSALEKQANEFQRKLDDDMRSVTDMTERLRKQREKLGLDRDRASNNAPWWVPVGMLGGLAGLAAFVVWFDRRRKVVAQRRSLMHSQQAQAILAMILEEADDEQIVQAVHNLQLSPNDRPHFLATFEMVLRSVPIPWYRPDVLRWKDRISTLLSPSS